MKEDTVVHFVCFDTTLDTTAFMKRWEGYKRSLNSDADVTLQQSRKKNTFRYIAQHRCAPGDLQFTFIKAARSSRIAQTIITDQQAGGYSILQKERKGDAHSNESKVFVFINSPKADLDVYRNLSAHGKLNIYSAYYENCKHAYIMEYFTPDKYVPELVEQLNRFESVETGVYKECALQAV